MCIFDFPCFSRFDYLLEHCLWCFGISVVFFVAFSTFGRLSLILDGSDLKFNTVLMRSPNVFGIFSLQILRFYWKSTILSNFRGLQYIFFEKYDAFGPLLMYLLDFPCFSRFDHVLKHCLWCFGFSVVFLW